MTLYANINKHSKYFKAQAVKEPFQITLNEVADAYCWSGNLNKYRTSDLDFYIKRDGEYFPSGIHFFSTETLFRTLENHLAELTDLSTSNDLSELEMLYQENFSDITEAMKKVISLLPQKRPTCDVCGGASPHCRCDW